MASNKMVATKDDCIGTIIMVLVVIVLGVITKVRDKDIANTGNIEVRWLLTLKINQNPI